MLLPRKTLPRSIAPTVLTLLCSLVGLVQAHANEGPAGRPPAVPLVVQDPYFSVWSFTDQLTGDWPRHWTGRIHALCGMARIDGQTYRVMGNHTPDMPTMTQQDLHVLPTRTIYQFAADGVELRLTFFSPVMPGDLDVLSRPLTYLVWQVRSADGQEHDVELYFDHSAELAVNEPSQEVVWNRGSTDGITWLRMGTQSQEVLARSGDDLRIDWGYSYLAVPGGVESQTVLTDHESARDGFAESGRLPAEDDRDQPRPANERWPVAACAWKLEDVGAQPTTRWLMLAYDDIHSIQYMGENLRPYWRRTGWQADDLLRAAADEFEQLLSAGVVFDKELTAGAQRVGGRGYANLLSLGYRHTLGAYKLVVSPAGEPMYLSKECFSNGCIGTVDVLYPASPIFMLFDNELLKATVTPVFEYAGSASWRFPFAPHDLGQYPLANGQRYGGGEESEENQMPVEESGNMLIVTYVICRLDGNPKYAQRYWDLLRTWAEYLKSEGLDPDNQLCTDDFTGHMAHNANLSLKAIVALACYGRLCEMNDKPGEAKVYLDLAKRYARQWIEMADDGDHFRLAFDKPGTWSQKYNLVWDKLLDLDLFPAEVRAKEVAFYKTKLQPYGLPLDNRALFTKTDWEVWTATLADTRSEFDTLMRPVYRFVDETPDRVPLTDWYWTDSAKLRGFRARPVIGGVFIKMLDDSEVWQRWQTRN